MLNKDYVRLGLACMAAVGVHGLFLFGISGSAVITQPESLIHVQLMPQPRQQESATQQSITQHHETQVSSHQIEHTQMLTTKSGIEFLTKVKQVVPQEETETASSQQLVTAEPLLVPDEVQSLIITNIRYPRWARYRGWEGEAELQFGVFKSVVQNISLFSSTGFDVLDQAAFQALASMESLPLDDGVYRLPVEFRLQ